MKYSITDNLDVNDNRLFQRFDSKFPAKFRYSFDDFGEKVVLRNVSADGAQITTRERFSKQDPVAFEVQLPDDHAPVRLKGEVVWVKNVAPSIWDVGIEFDRVRFMHLSRLYKHAVNPTE